MLAMSFSALDPKLTSEFRTGQRYATTAVAVGLPAVSLFRNEKSVVGDHEFRREQGRGGRSRGRRPGRPAAEAVRGRTDHRGGDEQEPPGLTDLPPEPLAPRGRLQGGWSTRSQDDGRKLDLDRSFCPRDLGVRQRTD